MKHHVFIALAWLLSLGLAAKAQTKDYQLNVGDFTEITVAHAVNVNYKQSTDSAGYISFSCDPKYASALTFDNNKGKLKIEIITDNPVGEYVDGVTVYSSCLSRATNLSDSTLRLLSMPPIDDLSLKVIGNGEILAYDTHSDKLSASIVAGNGHIFVSGTTREAKFSLASVGSIEAGQLTAQKVKCEMFGTGSIDCSPASTLSVYGATSGTIYYMGNPQIKKRCIGVKLVKIDSDKAEEE